MKRISWKWVWFAACLMSISVMSRGRVSINFSDRPYLDEKLKLHVNLEMPNSAFAAIRDVRIFYRDYGHSDFQSHLLDAEGFRYVASVDLSAHTGQTVEYFFAVDYMDGGQQVYPEEAPVANLFEVNVNQSFDSGDGIVVISPEPNEIIYADEFLLTVSFFELSDRVDTERTKVFLDQYDVSRSQFIQHFGDFLTFSPRRIPPGRHDLRVELYSRSGQLLTQREWSFSATPRKGPVEPTRQLNVNGNAFAEARTENINDGAREEQYNKIGLDLNAGNRTFSFGGRLYLSNQEVSTRQPVNRYGGWAQANFWGSRFLRLHAGDTYPQLSPFLLQNIFLRGFHGQLYFNFLNIDFASGKSLRAIDSRQTLVNTDTLINPGTFARDVWGTRVSFGMRQNFQLGLTAVKGRDDVKSIQFGDKPEESLATGMDIFLATPDRRIILEGSINASSYNPDIIDGEDVPYDTLLSLGYDDLDESLYDQLADIVTINQNLVAYPGIAYHGTVRLNVANNNIAVTYRRVDSQFNSLGQPFLLRDTKGLTVSDNVRLFQNQLFVNLRFQQYENNLGDVKAATTENRSLSFNVSYFPLSNLPSLNFGFSNFRRDNGLKSVQPLTFPEDNSTNTITFSTGYNFNLSGLRNHLTLSVLNYNRSDATDLQLDNLSNTFTFLLQTRYQFPLRSRLEFNFQQNENTAGNTNANDLSLNSFGGGLEYQFNQILSPQGTLQLSVNGRYGLVNSTTSFTNALQTVTTELDYNRSFINTRVIYSVPRLGRISLNGDWVNYSGDRGSKDYILTARYDVGF